VTGDPRLGPDPEELVARVLAGLRRDGLLPPRPPQAVPPQPVAPAPAPQGPSQGPRVCPQRSRKKRIGTGPKAHQPLRGGVLVPKGKRVRWTRG
jgi:hypothetical protein